MKLSLNWLKNYTTIPALPLKELGELITIRTAEVEETMDLGALWDKIVLGVIEEIQPHPDATKLQVTRTNVGDQTLQIVCGAKNIFVGQKVAVALPGAQVRWHGEGDLIKLEPTKIRGVESFGMICAGSEIGLEDLTDGIRDFSHLSHPAGTSLASALQRDDQIIDIENKTLTHRPDLWGHYGFARELAAIFDTSLKPLQFYQDYPQRKSPKIPVTNQEPELCPRYLSVSMSGITVRPSPEWLKSALENVGQRSINNIVDATNFVMLELGNPLHAFDSQKISHEIIIRKASPQEKIVLLDGEEVKLPATALVIADAQKALAIAGIKGGQNSGVTSETTQITLEAANFDPIAIRKTSTELGVRTDAVQRFEKSLDPLLAEQALDRLVKIILDLCPEAQIEGSKIDLNNFEYRAKTVTVDPARVSRKIGVNIDAEQITAILQKLTFQVSAKGKNLVVEIPSHRATKDINHFDDLVEEIARLYGYENLPNQLPLLQTHLPPQNPEQDEANYLRNSLSQELGYHETVNYSYYSLGTATLFGLPVEKHLLLENYLSEEQTHLRVSLLPNLLKVAAENLKNQNSFRLFELGRTYLNIQQFFPLEEKKIAGIIVLDRKDPAEPFYQIKSTLQHVLGKLRVRGLLYGKAQHQLTYAHPAKHASYTDPRTKQEVIQLYELHPLIAKRMGLEKSKVAAFEINFTQLLELPRAELKYQAIPRFPGIEFDVSALIDRTMPVEKIEKAIKSADQNLIHRLKLFDLYQGANIPSDKKAVAYKIFLQAADRTLTDAEMKAIQNQIFNNLQKLGAEIRGL